MTLPNMLDQVARIYLEEKNWTRAEPILRECLTIRQKRQPDALRTFHTQSMLGGAMLGLQKYAEAEPLLLKGYEGVKQREGRTPSPGEPRLAETLDRLIDLYTTTNQPDEAKKWRAKRAK